MEINAGGDILFPHSVGKLFNVVCAEPAILQWHKEHLPFVIVLDFAANAEIGGDNYPVIAVGDFRISQYIVNILTVPLRSIEIHQLDSATFKIVCQHSVPLGVVLTNKHLLACFCRILNISYHCLDCRLVILGNRRDNRLAVL